MTPGWKARMAVHLFAGVLSVAVLHGCDGETKVEIIGAPTATATAIRTRTMPPATATGMPATLTPTGIPTATHTQPAAPSLQTSKASVCARTASSARIVSTLPPRM